MTRTIATLFTGFGGFDLGAHQAGYTSAWGIEYDAAIAGVAQTNGLPVMVADVRSVDYTTLPAVDHLHASPPCTTASVARAQQRGDDGNPLPRETATDRELAAAVCRAIRAHVGATFSLENVWGYRSYESFRQILETLSDCGFGAAYWPLNAADYGVPQVRKRLILLARRNAGYITRLTPTHRNGGDMFHAPWISWHTAIADLIPTLPVAQLAPWQAARMPGWDAGLYTGVKHTRRPVSYVRMDAPCTTMDAINRPSHMPLVLIDGALSTTTDGKALQLTDAADPAPTQVGSWNNRKDVRIITGLDIRRATPRCMARWQAFPDDYQLPASNTLAARGVGNAVPVLLAQRIMEAL